jgi:hypothetical protein
LLVLVHIHSLFQTSFGKTHHKLRAMITFMISFDPA